MSRLKVVLVAAVAMLVAAFGSLTLASPAAALNCAPGTYSVSTNVNVRIGASTSARIVRTLPTGSSVEVVGERAGTLVSSSSLWCEVNVNAVTGFVHSGALTPGAGSTTSSNTPASNAQPAEITASTVYHVAANNRVNGRATPSTSASVVAQLPGKADVIVTGQAEGTRVSGSTVWYQVSYDGQQMYVHSSLLAAGSGTPATQPAPQANNAPAGNSVQQPVQPPATNNSFVCPRNCAGAVAMGLSAQQAATCPGLDRDRDGVACYGD